MQKRQLGRTELQVSGIGLGGANLLGRAGDQPLEGGVTLIRRALALGINYIDTSECYIGGRSEEVVGATLEGYTDECIVATKFGHRPPDFDYTRASVLASAGESLRLLRGRAIDLFQLHTPGPPAWEQMVGSGGILEGMREVKERGWCRYLGITGYDLDFLARCIETDAFDTMLLFLRYDLLDQTGEPLLAQAAARDMGIILGSPLRMGLFGANPAPMLSRSSDTEKQSLAALHRLLDGEPGGLTAGAFRFAMTCPQAAVILSGASSIQEIEEITAIAETPMTPEQAQAVRRIATEENTGA